MAGDESTTWKSTTSRHVVVVVLGDVGRSPRMQYHALSLLEKQQGGRCVERVSLVGYEGEDLVPDLIRLSSQGRLSVVRFSPASPPKWLRKILPLYYLWRIASLLFGLLYAICVSVPKQSGGVPVTSILVQNPPAIPTLLVGWAYCMVAGFCRVGAKASRPRFLIDWHNLGYTMLREGSLVSKVTKAYEKLLAPLADGHLCVTEAMRDYLVSKEGMNIPNDKIRVLYDCPPAMFRPLALEEQYEFMKRLDLASKCPRSWSEALNVDKQTLFTEDTGATGIVPRHNRPALVTSSTSWTEDEDFGILLDALVALDNRLLGNHQRVLVCVTGKGPEKAMYEERISKLALQQIAIVTLWLEPGDYPMLLACADVGVSLHTSTSGRDLPMKVLDLFGCETPVCAVDFQCLNELVRDGVNGKVFATREELTEQLYGLLSPLAREKGGAAPHSFGDLAKYSKNLQGRKRWADNWNECARPIVLPDDFVDGM